MEALGIAGFGWWVGIVEVRVQSHTGTEQHSTEQRDGITVPTDMGTTQPPSAPGWFLLGWFTVKHVGLL